MKYRLNRLFRGDGKCVMVALDHAAHNEVDLLSGVEDLAKVVYGVATAGPDGILLSIGQAAQLQSLRLERRPALMVRVDATNVYSPKRGHHEFCQLIGEPVEQALRLDAAGVLVNLFFVPENPSVYDQCVHNICQLKPVCERYAMPLMIEPLILEREGDGPYRLAGDLMRVMALTRQAVELGADVIKADPTDSTSLEDYRKVVEIAGSVPLLPRGGSKVGDREILSRTRAMVSAGARGVVYGRNIFQHPKLTGMLAAIRGVVHDDLDVESALEAVDR